MFCGLLGFVGDSTITLSAVVAMLVHHKVVGRPHGSARVGPSDNNDIHVYRFVVCCPTNH